MTAAFSVYLEIVRIFATAIVFIGHSKTFYKPLYDFCELYNPGRDGVIIFFVLSGFVISWCAENKDKVLSRYIISRTSRIYSVAIPAILLSFIISFAVSSINGTDLPYQFKKVWIYLPVYLSFTGGIWSLNEVPPINFPYWSLNYEVWYYIIFSVMFFFKTRWKWVLAAFLLGLVGPSIVSLFPIWLLGSGLYFYAKRIYLNRYWSRFFFVVSLIGFLVLKIHHVDNWLDGLSSQVSFGDYSIGIIVFLNFYFAINSQFKFGDQLSALVRHLASVSFSFYLFHMPLYELCKALVKADDNPLSTYFCIVLVTTILIIIFARYTEHKKKYYVMFFLMCIERFKNIRVLRGCRQNKL